MSVKSRQIVLGTGLAVLMLETIVQHPLFTTSKVALFKVVTPRDTIVIGLSRDELEDMHGKDAAAVARAIDRSGAINVWQYGVRRNNAGELEQAPIRQIGLMSSAAVRVEAYESPLKVVPVTGVRMN